MTNVVAHPNLAAGSAKVLARRIEPDRRAGIAHLRRAIDSLARLAEEPGCGFVGDYIVDYESVLLELEALDPAAPPSVEEVRALGMRLARLDEELRQRIIYAKPDALSGSRELPRSGAGNLGQREVPVTPKGPDYP